MARKLYVGNLPYETAEQDLQELFASVGTVETVKAVNDLYSPCTGEVTAVNARLDDDPNLITQEPLGAGWMFKVRLAEGETLDHLQTYEQYQKQIAEEEH